MFVRFILLSYVLMDYISKGSVNIRHGRLFVTMTRPNSSSKCDEPVP